MPIVVPIDADVSGLTRKISSATSSLGGFGRMATFVAGAAALGGLVATVKVGVDEFMQAEKVTAQTNAVLKSTSGVANVTAKQVDALASSIMRKSGMDDEAVKSAENLLLTFTKVRNEAGAGNDVFNQATKVTADLSVALGKDLNSSAMLVGKALNDPIKGVSALGRAGVQFTAAQKDQLKAMVESGNVMGAQKMILKELTTQVGGSADAFGKTLPGQLSILRETFNNLAGELVASFMPSIARAAQGLVDFVTQLQAKPTFEAKIKFVIGSIGNVAWTGIESLYTWWNQQGRIELPARVVLIPSGRQQFDQFFTDLEESARAAGKSVGEKMILALVGVFSKRGREEMASAARSFSDTFGGAILTLFRVTGTTAIMNFMRGMLDAIPSIASRIGPALQEALTSAVSDATKALPGPIRKVVEDAFGAVRGSRSLRVFDPGQLAKRMTDDMKAAVQSARSSLQSSASSLAGMLNQIVAVRGTNPTADLAAARDLEDRRLSIQEASLKAARDATEENSAERTQAQLDLDQFYFDKAATLRQRQVDDEQKKNQTAIDNLVTRFNKGLDSAAQFNAGLDALIGGEAGTSLGDAFAFGFQNALQSLKNQANDIANIVGKGNQLGPDVGAPGSFNEGGATSAARAQYQQDLADWRELQRLKRELRNADDKGKAAARRALNAFKRQHADLPDRQPTPAMYGIDKLATGGILTGPRYLAGEAGNEAVIPLASPTARDMMRKAFSEAVNGGGDTVYNISINAGMGADGTDIGRQIVEAIKVFERRNGPVFAGA